MKTPEEQPVKWGRRKFVAVGALGATAMLADACSSVEIPQTRICETSIPQRRKAIIIGSGFAGSIAAHRLTEAGYEVLLLERGQFWDTGDGTQQVFAPAAGLDMRNIMITKADKRSTFLGSICANPFMPPVYRVERYAGVMERFEGNNMTVILPALLGGGTAVYGGIFAQPKRFMFEQVFPAGLSYDEMDAKWFPKAKQGFGATPMPEDIAQKDHFLHYERFREENANAGFESEKLDITYDWNKVREELNGTRIASSIHGDSMFGCSSGARNSSEFNYLKWAQDTGRLEIKTLSMVTDVAKNCDGNYIVFVNEIDVNGNVINQVKYSCEYLFMASGSVNTSKLMVKAKAKGYIPNLNDQVGKGWGHNGSTFVLRQSLSRPTGQYQAFPPNYGTPDFDNPIAPIYIEHLAFPMGFECDCLSYFAIGLVKDFGTFHYQPSKDDVYLDYPHPSRSYQKLVNQAFYESMQKINQANGGSFSQVFGNVPKSDTSAHPCGGMVMGKATDLYGRVLNQDKLYVLDGALIPGSCAGANPAFTIAALTERNIEHILEADMG